MNALAFSTPAQSFSDYSRRFNAMMGVFDWSPVERLAYDLLDCWQTGRQVFLIGNGGSAANASHLASDFLFLSKTPASGLLLADAHAYPAVGQRNGVRAGGVAVDQRHDGGLMCEYRLGGLAYRLL